MTLALSLRVSFCLNTREVKGPQLSTAMTWEGTEGSGEEKAGSMESRSMVPKLACASKSPGERLNHKSLGTTLDRPK